MKTAHTGFACVLLVLSGISAFLGTNGTTETEPNVQAIASATIVVQEEEMGAVDDMHRFMGFISKPAYKELKTLLSEEDLKRSAFRKVQQHAMILGETANLVAERGPEDPEQNAEWRAFNLENFKAAKALYAAAGEKDTAEAKKQYGLMIDACNKCHSKYDENDHQLAKFDE
jgi:hypothetical protein